MNKQKGFTLVEIAIVMVIIGLLLGGVLKGQEVITNAKLKRAVNDFNGVTAAIYSYQDRYQAIPGDDSAAVTHLLITPGNPGYNGSGNGAIGGAFNSGGTTNESRLFWMHLRNAELVGGVANPAQTEAYQQPLHPWSEQEGVAYNTYGMRGHGFCYENLTPEIASILDSQNDDGVPNSGSVQSGTGNTAVANVAANYTGAGPFHVCFRI